MDVLDRFLDTAKRLPNHISISDGDVQVTYGQLAERVGRMACDIGVNEHPKVLIYLSQCCDSYGAMFATLMAGGYYAPVNIEAPLARQRLVIDQFCPDVVVTSSRALEKGGLTDQSFGSAHVVDVDDLGHGTMAEPRPPHELAYVMFTSGSTGVPKGVMVGRQGLGHYIDWAIEAMAVTPQDKWSQFPPISFDLSVLDIYGALCAGATLYPFVQQIDRMMPALGIQKFGLTIWNSVPSVVGMMAQAKQLTAANLKTLRLATFCGEPLFSQHVEGLFGANPDLQVHNTYGPTEATVSFTLIPLTQGSFRNHCTATVALGAPITGMDLHLVGGADENEGEIVITGPQVAKGYWGKPDLSKKVFRSLTVSGQDHIAYYTGDWAVRKNGDLYFMSRIDSQVKIHGFRVELEDVNAAVRNIVACDVSSVVVENDLHCFIENVESTSFDPISVVDSLRKHLENYAIPKFFHQVDSLPRNVNDKIDLKALEDRVQKGAKV